MWWSIEWVESIEFCVASCLAMGVSLWRSLWKIMRWSIVARCVAVDRLCAQFVGRCVHKVIRTRWENLYEDHSEKLWGDRLSCASCTTTTQQDAKLSCTTQWDWWVEKIFQWSARCKRIAFDFIRLWNYELSDLQSTVTVKQTPPPPPIESK